MNDLAQLIGFSLLSDEEQEPETLELGAVEDADDSEDDDDGIADPSEDDDDADDLEEEEEEGADGEV